MAGNGVRGLGIWLALVGLGFLWLGVEVVRSIVRAKRRAGAAPPTPAGGPARIENPPAGVVPLGLEPSEPNARDPRRARFVGPFTRDEATADRPALPWTRTASPPLRGRVVLLSMFVGADGRWWTDSEIARQLDALERAARWMEKQAGRYGVELGVGPADVYFSVEGEATPDVEIGFEPEGAEFGPYEAGSAERALTLMSRAAAAIGFHDAVDLVREIHARLPDATPVWLLHVRQAGRSMAVPLDLTELEGVSLALCFAREANFTEPISRPPIPDAATLAHETLHLFGASDKYGAPLSSFDADAVTHRDIMRLDYDRLDQLRVDPLTAREIGWGGG